MILKSLRFFVVYKNQTRISDKKACRAQTAYFSNAQKVRATRYKSRPIIEAEQNVFGDIFINISLILGFSRLTSCILFTLIHSDKNPVHRSLTRDCNETLRPRPHEDDCKRKR